MYEWLLTFLSAPTDSDPIILVGSIALALTLVQCFFSYFIGAFVNIFRKY